MKFILHVGMHKTGSSSIQDTLVGLKNERFTYLPGVAANHSGWFVQQFDDEDKLDSYHGFQAIGLSRETLLERRARSFHALEFHLKKAQPETVIVSAESMSTPRMGEANRRMAEYIAGLGAEAEVIGYLRPPASFATSIFQQMLKGQDAAEFRFDNKMPNYRVRLERFDTLFGRDRVTLRKFHPSSLHGGDVVLDFAHQIGLDLAPEKVVRSNESLSKEAAALLYVQRKFGRGFVGGFVDAHRHNFNFIRLLSRTGSTRFAFAPEVLEPMLFIRRKDVEWAETRIGESLAEDLGRNPDAVRSEDDLIATAMDQRATLNALTEGRYPLLSAGTPEALGAVLDSILEGLIADDTTPEGMKAAG